jgi:hypothetical protein
MKSTVTHFANRPWIRRIGNYAAGLQMKLWRNCREPFAEDRFCLIQVENKHFLITQDLDFSDIRRFTPEPTMEFYWSGCTTLGGTGS